MADETYVVTAACAMVKAGDRLVTVAKGGAVPADADPEHVALLLDRGMIAEGEPVAGFVLEPGYGAAEVVTPLAVDDVDGDGPIPAKSANKDAWVAYAVSQGADQAEAEAATKDDLIATYGTA